MSYYYLVMFWFTISVTYSIDRVLGLKMENIINGLDAKWHYFKYQVAVLGKYNFSNEHYLVCGGGILADKIILSAAHCFIDELAILKNMSFTIAAGTDDLTIRKGVKEDVDAIYFPPFSDYVLNNDIAILMLKKAWKLEENPLLMKLFLPTAKESISMTLAKVAGFGFNTVQTRIDKFSGIQRRVGGNTDYRLRFEHVYVTDNISCKNLQPTTNITNSICGLMVPLRPIKHAGTCHNLKLPAADERFNGKSAVITGFGLNWFTETVHKDTGEPERTDENTDFRLRLGFVNIVNDAECIDMHPLVNVSIHIYGVMVPNPPERRAGICSGDSGSALVFLDKVVGSLVETASIVMTPYMAAYLSKLLLS